VLDDPRTAVASGAALQGAVLSGVLDQHVLLDVTPLALGLLISPEPGVEEFSTLIPANTHIPVSERGSYTTTTDNQETVLLQIYSGDLRPGSKIGEFQLRDIAPAPAGEPQIEVTFSIDASCVLEVTAKDTLTGNQRSIKVADTTLLSPDEIAQMSDRRRTQLEREEERRRAAELRAELAALAGEAGRADAAPVLREFRARLAAHDPNVRPDPATERVLAEIYGPAATELETELLSMRAPLRDLTAKAREYLAADDADLAQGAHLHARLKDHLDRVRPGLAQVALWNAVLARLATVDADPLRRFRAHHAAGDHARALEALAELPEPPSDPADVRRRLHSLAETGAAEEYGRVLAGHAGPLGFTVLDPDAPEGFLRRAREALVKAPSGAGFLISDRLAVAARPDGPGGFDVETALGPRRVGHVFTPDSPLHVALLQLTEPLPVRPLRLGHAGLVRIGDAVRTPGPGGLLSGVVDAFEQFPEQGLTLYRMRLRVPPDGNGGPLFNEHGEVIGVLTGSASASGEAAFAVTVDTLAPLLTGAGFGAAP
jgi:molecular chaperone DnaK